jgi:hypothetical protein
LLNVEKQKLNAELNRIREKWSIYGVPIISDGWTKVRNQALVNVIALNCFGLMFLEAEDFSGIEKSRKNIVDYLLKTMEQVGVYNIMQVVTNNAVNFKTSTLIEDPYPHIFSPEHTLNLIFKELAKLNIHIHISFGLLAWF